MSAIEKINYSIQEASKASGLSISKLYKLSAKRQMPIEKIGSRVLIPKRDFELWLRKFKVRYGK